MDIDNILEEDLMAALDGMDSPAIDSMESSSTSASDFVEENTNQMDNLEVDMIESITDNKPSTATTIDASSMDIASLLKELLNDKSLEITIRLKDN